MSRKKFNPEAAAARIDKTVKTEDTNTQQVGSEAIRLSQENKLLKPLALVPAGNVPNSLDQMEEEIKQFAGLELLSVWLQGERLAHIRDNELYKERGVTSFVAYCEQHLKFTRQTAYNAIFVFQKLDWNKAKELKSDPSKIYLLRPLKDDDSKFAELLTWIEQQKPSRRELQARLAELNPPRIRQRKDFSVSVSNGHMTLNVKLPQDDISELAEHQRQKLEVGFRELLRSVLEDEGL